jgi:alcohol dehydrogenase class IV
MLRTWEFQLATRVLFGRGTLRRLGEVAREFGKSALLVGYAKPGELEETYGRATIALRDAGMTVTRFLQVTTDPGADLVIEGTQQAHDARAEVVIGLGGGSVIDAAKGIAAVARMGGSPWDYTAANRQCRPISQALPVVAVPTTAGTGTEVTAVAVFTYHDVGSAPHLPLKTAIFGPAICPRVAVVDPDLSLGSPPLLTAASGADALGHAIEACMSRRANPISSTLGGRAVALIVNHLRRAVENPMDPEPREALALAATLAGAAFNEAGVVVPHAIAHALGALLNVPHSLGVALATPASLRFNAERCLEPYCELATCCGLESPLPEQRASRFVNRIIELLRDVGLLNRIPIPADAPPDLLDRLVRNAMESSPGSITFNPRKLNEASLRELFREVLL